MSEYKEIKSINKLKLNYYREFVRNNIFVLSSYIINYTKGIILLPLLVKNIGIASYGGYVLISLGLGFIAMFSPFGVGFNFKRFMSSSEGVFKKRNLFYPQFVFQMISVLVVSIILISGRAFISEFFLKRGISFSVYIACAVLIILVLFYSSIDYFRYNLKVKYYSIAVAVEPLLMVSFILAAFFLFNQKSINSILLASLTGLLVITLPLLVKIYKEIGLLPFTFDIRKIIDDIRLGFPLVLSYVLDFIISFSDRYIIGILISAAAVGYYNPAYTVGSILILFPKICSWVILQPLLSNAADNNKNYEIKIMIEYTIKIFLVIAIPFIAGSLILSKPLLQILINKDVADKVCLLVPVIAVGVLFYGLALVYSQILFIKLKTKVMFTINALCAVLNLILNIILIYVFKNIMIAAFTTLVSYFLLFIILNKKSKEYFNINYDFIQIGKCVLSAGIMAVVIYYTRLNLRVSFVNIVFSAVLAAGVYFFMLYVFRFLKTKEIRYIKNFLSA
jgi:O-antigen/teichoic acid export membrane protein